MTISLIHSLIRASVEDLGCLYYLLLDKIARPNSISFVVLNILILRFTLMLCTICELVRAAHILILTLLYLKDENIKLHFCSHLRRDILTNSTVDSANKILFA